MWGRKEIDADIDVACKDMLIGKQIGSGTTREVFIYDPDPNRVIKACTGMTPDANIIEWNIWNDFAETDMGKDWLAECHSISHNGRLLVQERLDVITSAKDSRLPKKIPRFLTDTKVTNWGVDDKGRVKCFDYGLILIMQGNPWQMKKADWWEIED